MAFTQTTRVVDDGEILLDDKRFRLSNGGPIRPVLVNQWPEKITQGDTSRGDQRLASEWVISDNRGGLGVEIQTDSTQEDRYWFATARASDKGEITLPFTYVTVKGSTNAATYDLVVSKMGVLTESYAAQTFVVQGATGSAVSTQYFWQYSPSNLNFTWCSGASTTVAATDYVDYNGKGYFACGNAYYTVAGGVATQVASSAAYFVVYDNLLIKIGTDNALHSSGDDGATWVAIGDPLPTSYQVHGMFTFVNNNNAPAIYISTQYGLLLWSYENAQFFPTPVQVPPESFNGLGACVWNGYAFYSDGLGMERYAPGVVQSVGLNRDDGLPSTYKGHITKLVPSLTDIYALVSVDDTSSSSFAEPSGFIPEYPWHSEVMGDVLGKSYVFVYTGTGWHYFAADESDNTAIRDVAYTNVFGYPSMVLGCSTGVRVYRLPYGVNKATKDANVKYYDNAQFTSSWFNAQMPEIDKVALSVKAKVSGLQANMSVVFKLQYYDNEGVYHETTLGTATSTTAGVPYFVFSLDEGVLFRQARVVADLYNNTGTNTLTPIIEYMSLRYARTLDALFGYSARIDCSKPYKGSSVNQQINDLLAIAQSKNLLKFAWRDAGETREVYVRVIQMSGQGSTGSSPELIFDVVLNEMSAN